jgi:FtsP/CotA-like multicopper oxidase with cupredoxin domain
MPNFRQQHILVVFCSLVSVFGQNSKNASLGTTHFYFIAADEVEWNYTPRGRNLSGIPHVEGGSDELAENTGAGGVVVRKAIYREYTDTTFSVLKARPLAWEHLGILGPLIRADVGDTIRVVFRNNTKIICSMHPHGLAYDKESEGALYSDGAKTMAGRNATKDGIVPPGGTYTYIWTVPERSGPAHGDMDSVIWMYHSHFVEGKDMNTGLIGPIIVTARGASKADGSPRDVDREFITAFAIFDESQSWYFDVNILKHKQSFPQIVPSARTPLRPYLIYSINGLIEGNLPMLTMKKAERVRWYMFANSNDDDVHTPHWHGQTALANHMRADTIQLTPMGMAVADMVADTEGTWLFHCHVNDHFEGGMHARFTVLP